MVTTGVGCSSEADVGAVENEQRSTDLKLCAAIKGNGPRILSHFTSLARITEELGMLDAAAGGSSGSISMFLYESMSMNAAVNKCGDRPCSASEKAARMALLLKSVHGYGEIVAQETGLAELAQQVSAIKLSESPTPAEVERAVEALRKAMNANVQAILNTNEILRMLREPDLKRRAFNVAEIRTAFSPSTGKGRRPGSTAAQRRRAASCGATQGALRRACRPPWARPAATSSPRCSRSIGPLSPHAARSRPGSAHASMTRLARSSARWRTRWP